MDVNNRIEYLIVDTSAFIKNVPLQEVGENVITEQSVINEITNKRQLRRLVVLPYDLVVKDVFPENIKFVTEFSKKTGDYTSLSSTDIKVIALTYQLEKEKVGVDHLKSVPSIVKTIPATKSEPLAHPKSIAGFYLGDDDDEEEENEQNNEEKEESSDITDEKCEESLHNKCKNEKESSLTLIESDNTNDNSEDDSIADPEQHLDIDLAAKFVTLNFNADDLELEGGNEHNIDDILAPVKHELDGKNENNDIENNSDDNDDEDDEGWITPSNVAQAKKRMDSDILLAKPAKVACMTTDFAMQNVLMQIGLNVAALDGRVIKQMRTFIFRCYACFKTTSIMTKVFCPRCGLKTLKKVAVSLDDRGNEQIHINFRKPLSARGKKFSLPTPQGGKHANNPIYCEDQPRPDQRVSKLAQMINDPLNDDYIAGYSPFVTRDVYSKSAILGLRSGKGGNIKYWMKKNPNESRRKRK